MKKLFFSYFAPIIYPFRIHDYYLHQIPLPEPEYAYPDKLSIFEAISVSWVFELIKMVLQILLIQLTLVGLTSYQEEGVSYLQGLSFISAMPSHYLFLILMGLKALLFPLTSFIGYELWSVILRGFAQLLEHQGNRHELATRILVSAQSSHVFSAIPIFGDFVQKAMSYFLMYAGIRKYLGASALLSLIILLFPLILLFSILSVFSLGAMILFF